MPQAVEQEAWSPQSLDVFRIRLDCSEHQFATGNANRPVEGWELAKNLGSQLQEEAMSGDPLGNRLIIVKILFRCVNFLCGHKYPGLKVCEIHFFVFLFPKVWLYFLGKTQRYA